jgi:hypothetical protein
MNRRHLHSFYSVPELLRNRVVLVLAIFLVAFGVRLLSWHDTRLEVGKVQTAVTADYKRVAQLLREGGNGSFFSSSSPLADLNNLGHPPGYSILIAATQTAFGQSDAAVQFVQIIADALSAVLIFLIVAELLPPGAGIMAGMLAAFSPQFAWNSVLLLPDSICVLPILIAIYLLVRATKNPRLVMFIIIGALVGISCWLRANAILLTIFVAAAVLARPTNFSLSLPRERDKLKFVGPRWRYALAVVFGTLLVVLPLTIRNAIVFHRFIPLSLGAGQTLLEGIADYDTQGRFGIPRTDVGIMKQEAEIYHRPDYYGTLFKPDGVERERARLSRGFGVIRAHPVWFAGVMARRATSMVRLERSRLISLDPPVIHSVDEVKSLRPVWSAMPNKLAAEGTLSPQTQASLVSDTCCWLTLMGNASPYGDQFAAPIGAVQKDVDYVLIVPIETFSGRMKLSVKGSNGRVYATAIVEALEPLAPADQRLQKVALPFVSRENGPLQIVFSNEASNPPNPLLTMTEIELYDLGPARFLWTRYPRFVVHGIQKIFLTAVMLPLAIIGLLILIFQKQSPALVILSIVPLYFFTVQSIVHTEYRYLLAVDYFLLGLVGVTLCWAGGFVARKLFPSPSGRGPG